MASEDGNRSTPPPAETLAWVESKFDAQSRAGQVNPGRVHPGRVIEVEELQGGMSSAIHRLHFEHEGQRAVLRRYTIAWWLEQEPNIPHDEARTLKLLQRLDVGVATPTLIAADPVGQHCDVPAVLMTEVPGSPDIDPSDPDDWATRLATCLAAIHRTPIPSGLAPFQRWDQPNRELPTSTTKPDLWRQAIAAAAGPLPDQPPTFLHRDFHPNNVHWSDGEICAVVDWLGACVGPASVDITHCRWNLAVLAGPETAERFTEHYRSLTGHDEDLLPFDLATILSGPVGPFPTFAWNALGRLDLTSESAATRIDTWLAWVLGS